MHLMVSIIRIATALVLNKCEAILALEGRLDTWIWVYSQTASSGPWSWNIAAHKTAVAVDCLLAPTSCQEQTDVLLN